MTLLDFRFAVRKGLVLATLLGTLLLQTGVAGAHPHVWISAHTDVVFDEQGMITAVDIQWEFDEFYSLTAVEGLDADGNGSYEASELRPLAEENITSLQEYGYFVVVRSGADKVALGTVTEFESTFRDGRLNLVFRVPLANAIDPKAAAFRYSTYDPSFYIAIELAAKNALGAIGTVPEGCTLKVLAPEADTDDAPQSEQSFLDLLQTQDLGSIYAESISVDCAAKRAS